VREVVPLKKVRSGLIKKVILKISADEPKELDRLRDVREIFEKHKGGTPVDFEVRMEAGQNIETLSIFARNTPIDPDDEVLDKLEEILGPDNVKITG